MNIFKIISTIIYTLLLLFILFMAGSLILNRLKTPIQYRIYSVQSGSMEPNLHVGSLIMVMPAKDYAVGDIVNVRAEKNTKETVTHRITEIIRDETANTTHYRLKGDNNEEADAEPVRSIRVNGKVVAHVPYLGYPVGFLQTQMGFVILVIIPATLIIFSELMNIKKEIADMIAKSKQKKQEKAAGLHLDSKTPTEKSEPEEKEEKIETKDKNNQDKAKKSKNKGKAEIKAETAPDKKDKTAKIHHKSSHHKNKKKGKKARRAKK